MKKWTPPDWLDSAVLIFGARKSGTTLLQNLCDGGHEALVYPSELKFHIILKRSYKSSFEARKDYFRSSAVIDKELPNFNARGYSDDSEKWRKMNIKTLDRFIRRDVYNVYKNVAQEKRRAAPSMWIAKEVGRDVNRILTFCKHTFVHWRIIMIVRNPKMVIRSFILRTRRAGHSLKARRILRLAWVTMATQYEQAQWIGEKGVYFVSYEELTAKPKTVMCDICRFLGIEYDSRFEYPTIIGERDRVDYLI